MVVRRFSGVVSVALVLGLAGGAQSADLSFKPGTSYLQCRQEVLTERHICYRICSANYPAGKRLSKRCHRSCKFDFRKDVMWCS
jgi:hypothetical protein